MLLQNFVVIYPDAIIVFVSPVIITSYCCKIYEYTVNHFLKTLHMVYRISVCMLSPFNMKLS